MGTPRNPHQGQGLLLAGTELNDAKAAMVMIHGRGADASSILSLASHFDQSDVAYVAPQAAMNTWYPQRFIAPIASNEPWLSSALSAIDTTMATIQGAGVPAEKTILLGFSQGACLALEYAARNPMCYGGVAVLSGGLIGPDGGLYDYSGSLDGTPVFLGCSDVDFHIPLERVHESAAIIKKLGASVTERIYAGMGHTINEDELQAVKDMMLALV